MRKNKWKTRNPNQRDFREPRYIAWRKAVYSRDGHKCQWPGCSNHQRLNAHHIRKWADFPELRYIVANGITLCEHHHERVRNKETDYELIFRKIVLSKIIVKLKTLHEQN